MTRTLSISLKFDRANMTIYDSLKLKLLLGNVTLQKRGKYRDIPPDIDCRKPNVYSFKHNYERRVYLTINTMHKSSSGYSSRRIKGAGWTRQPRALYRSRLAV